jgi:uncharacterized membrane protein YgaE (UPF0421/DUF939 family)
MKIQKKAHFIGGRIVKTGVAVFVTALICQLLNWPPMFAVITAIVTIEPTAADSVKKAFVRFPASAIGAGFAVLFTYLLGESALSYACVTLATIIVCYKFKLQDGILVATLTGVAMISTVHDHYVSSFFIRLGTTSTGLVVSSLVNILLMPPKYSRSIKAGVHTLFQKAGDLLYKRGLELFEQKTTHSHLHKEFQQLMRDTNQLDRLFHYQEDEWKFHHYNREDIRKVRYDYKKFSTLRQINYHIGNLIFLPSGQVKLDSKKSRYILTFIQKLQNSFDNGDITKDQEYQKMLQALTEWFINQKSSVLIEGMKPDQHYHIAPETAVLYEIISINDLIEELINIESLHKRHQELLTKEK